MVGRSIALLAEQTVWQQLSAIDQARLTLALLAFVALLIGCIAFVLLMGRIAKHEIRKPLPAIRDTSDLWACKPPADDPKPPPADAS